MQLIASCKEVNRSHRLNSELSRALLKCDVTCDVALVFSHKLLQCCCQTGLCQSQGRCLLPVWFPAMLRQQRICDRSSRIQDPRSRSTSSLLAIRATSTKLGATAALMKYYCEMNWNRQYSDY